MNKIQEIEQHELEIHNLLDSALKISDAFIIIMPLYVIMICCLYMAFTFRRDFSITAMESMKYSDNNIYYD